MPCVPVSPMVLKGLQNVIYEAECASRVASPVDSERLKALELEISALYRDVCTVLPERFHEREYVVEASARLPAFRERATRLTATALTLLAEMKQQRWFILICADRYEAEGWFFEEESQEIAARWEGFNGNFSSADDITSVLTSVCLKLRADESFSAASSIRAAYLRGAVHTSLPVKTP